MSDATAGLLIREFWRREAPTVLEVRVGLVRVCLEDVRRFNVARVVAVELAIILRRGTVATVTALSSRPAVLGKAEIFYQRSAKKSGISRENVRMVDRAVVESFSPNLRDKHLGA